MIKAQREEMERKEIRNTNIKFKTLGRQILPYLHQSQLSKSISLNKFTKKSYQNCWREKSNLSKDIKLLKLQQQHNQNQQLQRLKLQLKNETNSLLLQKRYMQKRFETNLLIRIAMKQLANNQQQLLNANNYFEKP